MEERHGSGRDKEQEDKFQIQNMITDSPMNIPDMGEVAEPGELLEDGVAVELWVEVELIVGEGVVLVADGLPEDELAIVVPAAPY
jgi:hypothetical protein